MFVTLRRSLSVTFTLAGIAVALSCAGCSSTSSCPTTQGFSTAPLGYRFGNMWVSARNEGSADNAPDSGLVRGPWFPYPAGETVTFEHDLGVVPLQNQVFLAFHATGTLALATGNLAIVEAMDSKYFKVKNDTCSQFYIWVQLSIPVYGPTDGDAGASDAEPSDTTDMTGAAGAPDAQ